MNILLVGSGGREHALAWKLAQSPAAARSSTARPAIPASPQIAELRRARRRRHRRPWWRFAQRPGDRPGRGRPRSAAGRRPRRRAARRRHRGVRARPRPRRSSKARKGFTKDLCARHGIPTAAYRALHRSARPRRRARRRSAVPVVIKADGLAAGKGVIVAETAAEADDAVRDMLRRRASAPPAHAVVIEEFLRARKPASSR